MTKFPNRHAEREDWFGKNLHCGRKGGGVTTITNLIFIEVLRYYFAKIKWGQKKNSDKTIPISHLSAIQFPKTLSKKRFTCAHNDFLDGQKREGEG